MTRDIRNRLARALERGEVRPAGSKLGPEMRRRLERALAVTPSVGEPPLPRPYSARMLADPARDGKKATFSGKLTERELETPVGIVQQYRWSVPLSELDRVQDLKGASGGSGVLSVLLENPALENLDLRNALYIDTETTGLAGGTGTYVFIVGMGWVEGKSFVVEQLFMRDFVEEPALLYRTGEVAGRFDVLVSFNGRRYDIPLLDTRLVMNRLDYRLGDRPHLDLLHPSRVLYGGTFDNCRLQTLEKELMGQHRYDDVPGSEIPRLFFDYLTTGDVGNLLAVFEHNLLDVVTLLTLTAHFMHLCQRPELDPRAMAGLGRLHGRRGNRDQALELLEQARSLRKATYRDLRDLGFLYKRGGEHSKALEVWKALIARQERASHELGFDAVPYVEAAKHYEHRTHDFGRALEFTDAALRQASATTNGHTASPRLLGELEHRAERLRRRHT